MAEPTAQVQASLADVKYALQTDPEFFIQFFLNEELTLPVPQFHIDIFKLMTSTNVDALCVAIPRDHAKTTLAKLATIWYFLFTEFRFIIYVSNTFNIARDAVNDIVSFLESENFVAVFGPINWKDEFAERRVGDGVYRFRLNGKICILRALGAKQQVRGVNVNNQRPQLAIVDDLEDNDNTATEDLQIKLKRWFYGPFKKCLDKFKNKIIHIGNLIGNKTLLMDHIKSEFWFSRLYGCLLSNGQPLWPEAWSVEKLKRDYIEYKKAGMADVWYAEMMNMPISAGRGLITADQIEYTAKMLPGEIQMGFITLDLAISKKTWAHETAIVVHGFSGTEWQIVDWDTRIGIDPINLFYVVMEKAYQWQVNVVGIESVAYQSSLKYVFNYLSVEKSMDFMYFVDLVAEQRKVERLAGWCAMLKGAQYTLPEDDIRITHQLLNYNPVKDDNDDDLIDACAYGPQMIERYMAEISETFSLPHTQTAVQRLVQVSEV